MNLDACAPQIQMWKRTQVYWKVWCGDVRQVPALPSGVGYGVLGEEDSGLVSSSATQDTSERDFSRHLGFWPPKL